MARTTLIVLFAGFALVSAGNSPHASDIEDLVSSDIFKPRFSDNVLEDAKLDVVSNTFYLIVFFTLLY